MSSSDRFIPLSVPTLQGREWDYVKECLDSGWVSTAGPAVGRFESMFAEAIGAKGAVCASSGTAALHLALILAQVKQDEEVLVPSMTFIAPVNAVRYVGAWPVFIDSNAETWQMDVSQAREFLENECDRSGEGAPRNRATGRKVTAILPVHILGYPVDLGPLYELAREYGLAVVEDSTESLGSSYHGVKLGSNSRFACFSFNGNKLITTGGGGMFVSDDDELLRAAKHLSTQAKSDPLEYVHDQVGYNYRLPSLLAAVGCAQLEQLSGFIDQKRRISALYHSEFQPDGRFGFMKAVENSDPVPWLYTVLLPTDARPLIADLKAKGIESRPLWQPNHLSKAHADAPRRSCAVAEDLYRRAISLPCSPNLAEADQWRVIREVQGFLGRT
jgi:perosamine synthetase